MTMRQLIVNPGHLPATARRLRKLFASAGNLFERGMPVKVVQSSGDDIPRVLRLSSTNIIVEAHQLCRPVRDRGTANSCRSPCQIESRHVFAHGRLAPPAARWHHHGADPGARRHLAR